MHPFSLLLLSLLLMPALVVLPVPGGPAVASGNSSTLPAVSQTIFPGMSAPVPGNVVPSNPAPPFPFSLAVDTSNGLVYAPTQGTPGFQQLVVVNGSYASRIDSTHPRLSNNTF